MFTYAHKHKEGPLTHTAFLVSGRAIKKRVFVREISKYWVTEYGFKYSKKTGKPQGAEYFFDSSADNCILDLKSVRPILK